ncbi:hypothetical protein B0T18DRAFT_189405 [Schizothecium vesticola]|uniref:Uncharacterized protein n=1 Tax=Schizothecium vesticola TaxID=314040 RepID=A0AA40EQM5_9PEZI|nr:hypothetical protein B0T18DRAFT_189405 [Schizothecium vesticola]
MPSPSHRRHSRSSDSDADEPDRDRHHAPNRGRRAASVNLSRRPLIESQGSYYRASSERRHHSPEDSTSDSDSDDGHRRRRRHRSRDDHSRGARDHHSRPSRQPSRASSRRSSPSPPRHRRPHSIDVSHNQRRGRGHSPSSHASDHNVRPGMRRRPSSAEPAPSSSRSKHEKGYYPPSASHTPKGPRHNTWPLPESMGDKLSHVHPPRPVGRHSDMLLSAGRTAFTAGAMAALKLKDDPTPWLGTKGAKVVAAGLSAACVDTFMESKHPKRKGGLAHTMLRQATNFAIGGLVVKPVEKGKVHIPQHMPTRRRSTKGSRESPDGGERRRRR